MRWISLLIMSTCLVTTGCSGTRPIDPDWNEKAGVQVLRLRWVKKLNPPLPNYFIPELLEEHDRFNPIETASAGFDSDRRRAFMGASTGGLYCLDLIRGETVWRFDMNDAVGSNPIYDPGRKAVFFGADNGLFYSLHARSGRQLWATDTGAEVRRKAIVHADTLFAVNADNTVLAIDPENGEVIWQYRRPPVEGFSSCGHAGLTLHNSRLYTGFSDGFAAAIDAASGTVVWSHDLASEVSMRSEDGDVKLIDVDATPVVVDNVLVAASVAGGLQGFNAESGTVMWTHPEITGVTGLAENKGVVYAARSSFGLTAVDPQSGRVLWSKRFSTGVLQDPIVFSDVLLVSDSEYGLFIVSTLDGELMQRIDQREGFFATPSIKNGYMLIIGNNGTVYAMSIL
ncbi:MAG: PQQ-binding-like beta-propeller repeat protein [Proteobacteria bacterium]|nr:PQQ-binding-like beta-propeller repeat protein [Pseudomonadota bacterium]